MELIITSVAEESGLVLGLVGAVDLVSKGEVLDAGRAALETPDCQTLVLDLSEVSFLDSTGLGALVELRNLAQANNQVVTIRNPSERASRVLAITGLDAIFRV